MLGKMCPKAGGKEELALNTYLLHASSPPLKGEEPRACPGDLTDAELEGITPDGAVQVTRLGFWNLGFPGQR